MMKAPSTIRYCASGDYRAPNGYGPSRTRSKTPACVAAFSGNLDASCSDNDRVHCLWYGQPSRIQPRHSHPMDPCVVDRRTAPATPRPSLPAATLAHTHDRSRRDESDDFELK